MKNYYLDDIYEILDMRHRIHYEFYSEQTESVDMLIY